MTKKEFLETVSKIDDTFEDEFRAVYNSPEAIWPLFEALQKRYDMLHLVFEAILVEAYSISELRDYWRKKAGVPTKGEE